MDINKKYRSPNSIKDAEFIAVFINGQWLEIWKSERDRQQLIFFPWVPIIIWEAIKDEDPRTILQIARLHNEFKGRI